MDPSFRCEASDIEHQLFGYITCLTSRVNFGAHVGQRSVVENLGHRVANAAHDDPGTAVLLIDTFLTFAVSRFTRARQRRQRTIDEANHRTDCDLLRVFGEIVTAVATLLAVDEAAVLQVQQDEFQELVRNCLLPRKRRNQKGAAAVVTRQVIQSS